MKTKICQIELKNTRGGSKIQKWKNMYMGFIYKRYPFRSYQNLMYVFDKNFKILGYTDEFVFKMIKFILLKIKNSILFQYNLFLIF